MWQLLTFFLQNMVNFFFNPKKFFVRLETFIFVIKLQNFAQKSNVIYYIGIQYEKKMYYLIKRKQGI